MTREGSTGLACGHDGCRGSGAGGLRQRQSNTKRLVEGADLRELQGRDVVGEQGLGEDHEGITMDAGFMLQTVIRAQAHLGGQSVATG